MAKNPTPVRLGMVGGGSGAFIGAVHRMAARLDGRFELVAGALSSTPERSVASGAELGLRRAYGTWEEMLQAESTRDPAERIEAVSIVTPNHMHYPVALAFVEAGLNVICDKPMTVDSNQARALEAAVAASGVVFGVTYNYTGYPLVKEARRLVASGALGELRKVVIEYHQGWLATRLEEDGNKQAAWRADPALAGTGGAIGDIGSHAENLAATVTGLHVEELCADLTPVVPGRRLDDDANVLLRFTGGVKGVLVASQVAIGAENDLRLTVNGSRGSLHWRQEDPNRLVVHLLNAPTQVLTRAGGPYLGAAAAAATRIPSGHPEGFIEAFAEVYRNVAEAIRLRERSANAGGMGSDDASPSDAGLSSAVPDYPSVNDGARGVAFIEAAVASQAGGSVWVKVGRGA